MACYPDAGHRHQQMGGAAAASGGKSGGVESLRGCLSNDGTAADARVLLCPTVLHPRVGDELHKGLTNCVAHVELRISLCNASYAIWNGVFR